MKLIQFEILNDNALRILEDLEKMNVIKLWDSPPTKNLSKKFRGKLSKQCAERLHNHIQSSRDSWERNI